jgi:hypothetical protein
MKSRLSIARIVALNSYAAGFHTTLTLSVWYVLDANIAGPYKQVLALSIGREQLSSER